jgi:hypothetical protein
LTALLGGGRVDPYLGQPLHMVKMLIRINDVNRLVATLKSLFNERKQHAVLFLVVIEKRADMAYVAELAAGKGYRPLHGVFLPRPFREPGYVSIQVSSPLSGWKILRLISVLEVPVFWDLGLSAKHASEELQWIVRVSQ